jgi:hypothetical protein
MPFWHHCHGPWSPVSSHISPPVNDILCHYTIDAVVYMYRLQFHLSLRSYDDSHSSPLQHPLETYRSSQSPAHMHNREAQPFGSTGNESVALFSSLGA